jgi:hypothetical protein
MKRKLLIVSFIVTSFCSIAQDFEYGWHFADSYDSGINKKGRQNDDLNNFKVFNFS